MTFDGAKVLGRRAKLVRELSKPPLPLQEVFAQNVRPNHKQPDLSIDMNPKRCHDVQGIREDPTSLE